jgi:chromosome partitioning protein
VAYIIGAVNQKGGTGKSTLCANLCWWLTMQSAQVTLLDADRQNSSATWLKAAKLDIPIYQFDDPDELMETALKLKDDPAVTAVVIDAPGSLDEFSKAVMMVCDHIVIPCGPSLLDIEATDKTIRLLQIARKVRKENGLPRAVFVPNKLQSQTRLSQELLEVGKKIGVPMAKVGIRLRTVHADARGQGTFVFKMGSKARDASEDLEAVFKEIFAYGR